jgi:hypothetical protein
VASEYEVGGLSQEAFSRQRDIPLKTLARYVTRYRKQKADGREPQGWVAVEVAEHSACGSQLAVLLSSGRRIEVKRGFDGGTLRQLVAVLEQA